jgi:hypothetical protein
MKKKTFKQIVEELKPLKVLTPEMRLPGYFDLMWDIKYGYEVFKNTFGILDNADFYLALAEHGFDANEVRKLRKYEN